MCCETVVTTRLFNECYLCLLFFSGHLLWEAAGDTIPFLEMAAKHVDPSSSAFYVLAGILRVHILLARNHELEPPGAAENGVISPRLGFPDS